VFPFLKISLFCKKNNNLKNSGPSVKKKNSVVLKKLAKKTKKIATLAYLQHERVLKIFYFHIQNVTKLS